MWWGTLPYREAFPLIDHCHFHQPTLNFNISWSSDTANNRFMRGNHGCSPAWKRHREIERERERERKRVLKLLTREPHPLHCRIINSATISLVMHYFKSKQLSHKPPRITLIHSHCWFLRGAIALTSQHRIFICTVSHLLGLQLSVQLQMLAQRWPKAPQPE